MKKIVLLSVVASTMIMAGGDIAPVEPVVEVVAVEEASSWNFTGQGVAFMQTRDSLGTAAGLDSGLFSSATTAVGLGMELGATNSNLFWGIGTGVKVAGILAGNDELDWTDTNFGNQYGAGITEAYLTYGFDGADTSIKVGRQTLPKSLSPFAFSEGWQMFKNTFEAALLVNSSIPNTALVYAWVRRANGSVNALPAGAVFPWISSQYDGLGDFQKMNQNDGLHMITAQNKSISNLTLTGSFYYGPNHTSNLGVPNGGDTMVLWGDATYKADMFTVAVQGGQISPDGLDDTTGFGAKIAGNLGMFDLSAAYTSVDDGAVRMANFGTSVKTPLYTQSILDQDVIALDADTFKIAAGMKALGGKFGLAYINADLGNAAMPAVMYPGIVSGAGTYDEIDFTFKTKTLIEDTTVFAGYVYQNDDRYAGTAVPEQQNFVRVWARYNF
ncbi:MAG: hypothetical protein U9O64_08235 [Campylobacterota bacterium]|nr:hypothetical protein [Campylobacterota bacterium]